MLARRRFAFVALALIAGCTVDAGPLPTGPDGDAPGDAAVRAVDLAGRRDSAMIPGPGEDLAIPGAPDLAAPGARDWNAHPAVFVAHGAVDLYAMGDVHGDPAAMIKTLRGAGLIAGNGPYTWAGGAAILVVTGDVIDKGTDALDAIDILSTLEADAAAHGGRVIVTLGNHEAEFLADPMAAKSAEFQAELAGRGLDPAKVAAGDSPYGAWLRARPIAALVDEWFLSHGGNAGGLSAAAIATTFQQLFEQGAFGDNFLVGASSVLESKKNWWGSGVKTLDGVLAALPAAHLVYGHQPNVVPCPGAPEGDRPAEALATCYDGRLFPEDVGMSNAVDPQSRGGLLHIHRGNPSTVTAIYPDRSTAPVWQGP